LKVFLKSVVSSFQNFGECGQFRVHQRESHHPARTRYFSELWRLSIKRLFHSITRPTTLSSTRHEESQGVRRRSPYCRRHYREGWGVEIASLLRISYRPPYRIAVTCRKGCRAIRVSALKAHISSIAMGGESCIQVSSDLRFTKSSYVGLWP